jgi:Leucine-rich repeat (LRR) protein
VTTIKEIHLRCTNITDEGVKYISAFKGLRALMLKDHRNITSKCLPYLQKLNELEDLDISKNKIMVADLSMLTGLKRLQKLHISSDMLEDGEIEIPQSLIDQFPGCTITMY